MKRALILATLLVAIVAVSGCFKTNFVYNNRAVASVTEESQTFLIFGLIGPDVPTRADRLCPSGVAAVQTKGTFGDMCIGAITFNIYTPRTVEVSCASGTAHNFYLDEQDNVVAHEVVSAQGEREIVDVNTQVY